MRERREALLATVDKIVDAQEGVPEISGERLKRVQERRDLRALWDRVLEIEKQRKDGNVTIDTLNAAVEEFFVGKVFGARRYSKAFCRP